MAQANTFTAGNNTFTCALYEQVRANPGNLFLSPFSVRTTLMMAGIGAAGDTATEMSEALRLEEGDASHRAAGNLIRELREAGGDLDDLAIANSLWPQEGEPLREAFLESVERHFGTGVTPVDFAGDPEAARTRINRWVETETRDTIRDLIPPGALTPETRLVLANAVYFLGKWARPFETYNTRTEPFFLAGGGSVDAELMRQPGRFGYARRRGFQVLELPYQGDRISMVVLLPDRKGGLSRVLGGREDALSRLESKLSSELLEQSVSALEERTVDVVLPRFKFSWAASLGPVVSALGIPRALSSAAADFSGINGHAPPSDRALFLSDIFHKAFVETDEKGTEASAASVVTMAKMMPRRPQKITEFRADHPFLFALRDRVSGTILMLGRVSDPTRQG